MPARTGTPETVGLSIGALYNAIGELARSGEEEVAETYLHVGADACLLMLLNSDGSLRAARSIPLGWRELTSGLQVDDEEASADGADGENAANEEPEEEELSFEIVEGEPEKGISSEESVEEEEEESEEESALSGAIFAGDVGLPAGMSLETALQFAEPSRVEAFRRRLANELRRGLEAMEATGARLYLMGADLPGLADYLEARLSREISPLDLGFADDDGNFADPLALGMALRGIGVERSPMNFRQEEYRYARGLERVEGPLTLALVGLIAFMVVDMVLNVKQVLLRKGDASAIYAEADRKVETLNTRVRDDDEYPDEWIIKNDLSGVDIAEEDRIGLLARRVKGAKTEIDKLMGEADVEMPSSCLEAWRLVMDYMDTTMKDWDDRWMIENFDLVSQDGGRSRGEAHVEVEFAVTLISENAQATANLYDTLEHGLSTQPWSVKPADIPNTEAADVAGARTAVITCYVRTQPERTP